MTDEQLKKGQDLKRTIMLLESELEKFSNNHPQGINVFLPNVGTLIENVKIVFLRQLDIYNRKFKEL
jgi:hypothetical protein